MKINNIVHRIRKVGYKCRITHRRNYFDIMTGETKSFSKFELSQNQDKEFYRLLQKGGETCVQVTSTTGKEYQSIAKCSNSDSFNRIRGYLIGLGRVIKKMKQEEGFDETKI